MGASVSPFGAPEQQQQQQQHCWQPEGKSENQLVQLTGHTVTTCLPHGGLGTAVGHNAQLTQHAVSSSAVMTQQPHLTQQLELTQQPAGLSQLVLGLDGTWQTPSGHQVLPGGWEEQHLGDAGDLSTGFQIS
jgi:hypothetical protein